MKDLSRTLRALSVETRLKILQALSEKPLCVGAIVNRLGLSQGAVSQHLAVLRSAGLVEDERRGYFIHYSLRREALEECLEGLCALFLLKEVRVDEEALAACEATARALDQEGVDSCAMKRKGARSRRS